MHQSECIYLRKCQQLKTIDAESDSSSSNLQTCGQHLLLPHQWGQACSVSGVLAPDTSVGVVRCWSSLRLQSLAFSSHSSWHSPFPRVQSVGWKIHVHRLTAGEIIWLEYIKYKPDQTAEWVEFPSPILVDWGIRTSVVRTLVKSKQWLKNVYFSLPALSVALLG